MNEFASSIRNVSTNHHDMAAMEDESCHSTAISTCSASVTEHDCCADNDTCPMMGLVMTSFIPAQHSFLFEREHTGFIDGYAASFLSITSPSLFRPPIV